MGTREHTLSDFLRKPKEVIRATAEGDVVLKRRGAPDLRVSQASREKERLEAYAMAAAALHGVAVHAKDALVRTLPEVFPWAKLLPRADLATFAEEFATTVASTADFENFGPLIQLVHEWRRTAEIHADPRLARRLRGSIEADGHHVPRPT